MELLWSEKKPVTSMELASRSEEYGWKSSYVFILIRSLLKKGMIEECGTVQSGTQYARQFYPKITKEEYAVRIALSLGLDKTSLAKVGVALVEEASGDQEQLIKELEEMLQRLRK